MLRRTRKEHVWQHSSLFRFTKVSWAIILLSGRKAGTCCSGSNATGVAPLTLAHYPPEHVEATTPPPPPFTFIFFF